MTNNRKKDKNLIYIGIVTAVIVIAVIVFFIVRANVVKDTKNNASNPNSQTAAHVSVIETKGSQDETIKKVVKNIRNVKFGKSHKIIDKYENKQKDTKKGSYASSEDGYSYMTYNFNVENLTEFFGAKPSPSDANSLLQYVFYNDKLIEVRLQYGSLGENTYNSIVSNINGTYGKATFTRSYSNGNKENWWKTKKTTLTAYYQSSGISIYYRTNK